jgi:hypothetical protein
MAGGGVATAHGGAEIPVSGVIASTITLGEWLEKAI